MYDSTRRYGIRMRSSPSSGPATTEALGRFFTREEMKMIDDTRAQTIALMKRALFSLDAKHEHLAGAHLADAICVLERPAPVSP